jgi:hypothetical protein
MICYDRSISGQKNTVVCGRWCILIIAKNTKMKSVSNISSASMYVVPFIERVLPWFPFVLSGLLLREVFIMQRLYQLVTLLIISYGLRCPLIISHFICGHYLTHIHSTSDGFPRGVVYLLSPHGATVAPIQRLCARLLLEHQTRPTMVIAHRLRYVPGFVLMCSMWSNVVSNDLDTMTRTIAETHRTLVVYPGGVKEVFSTHVTDVPLYRLARVHAGVHSSLTDTR